jgi:hypothetical protein
VIRNTISYFINRDEAEQEMNSYEEKYDKIQYSLYGFIIEEYEPEVTEPINEWSYIPDVFANLLDENTLSKKREEGNLFEVLQKNTVTLEIVKEFPLPHRELLDNGQMATILNHPGYGTINIIGSLSYPSMSDMFPPRFPVSDELHNKLKKMLLNNKNI